MKLARIAWPIALLFGAAAALAQMPVSKLPAAQAPPPEPADHIIRIPVQVNTRKGVPVPGLSPSDFTLLDNNQPVPISSFRQLDWTKQPVEAILVFDAVNTRYENVSYERSEVDKFLRQSGAKVPIPMELAVLTDRGVRINNGFTQDTGALTTLVQNAEIELRAITRAAGFWGADERFDTSIAAIDQLTQYAAGLPGRKIILFLSPGWPLLSGPEILLDAKQHQQIFSNVISLSATMRRGNITLDSLNPLGPVESLLRQDYYQSFLRGVRNPRDTDLADLSVQVLALQSGGVVLNSTDVAGQIKQALSDSENWYELSFKPLPPEPAAEYHHIQIKVDQPNLVVRTRDGYYNQPAAPAQ